MVDNIITAIRFIVTIITLFIWTFIGFFLWIPLLTRMISYFTGMVAVSTFKNANVTAAQQRLNFAIEFYINGFKKILGVLSKTDSDEITLENTEPFNIDTFIKSVVIDIVWTIIFWSSIILLLYYRFYK